MSVFNPGGETHADAQLGKPSWVSRAGWANLSVVDNTSLGAAEERRWSKRKL